MSNAPTIHLGRYDLPALRTVMGCALRVLADSDRTQDIVTAEEIASQAQLKHLVSSGVFSTPAGVSLLQERPDFDDLDMQALASLPPGSLGASFASFLSHNKLSTSFYSAPTPHTQDPECAYLLTRTRQSHDLWHVLMNFTVQGHDEILLHAFSLAQTGFPSSVALMALGSLKHMLLEARFACFVRGMREAYRRGRDAADLLAVRWEDHWEEPLEKVRRRYGIVAWSEQDRRSCEPWRFRMAGSARLGSP